MNCVSGVVMSAMTSQITGITIVYSIVFSGADQRKHQSSASLAFVRRIHRWLVNSPHKGPKTRKMFHLMTSHDPGLSSLMEHWLHQTVTLVIYLYRLVREQLCNSRQVWWESKERETTETETEISICLWQGQVHMSITNVLCASLSLLDGQPLIPQNPL